MKKYAFLILSVLLFCAACSDDENDVYKTYLVTVQLAYPSGSELSAVEGVPVKLTGSTGTTYDATFFQNSPVN